MSAHRILILANRIPYPLTDGGNLAMNAMIRGYHDAGWQVFLLAMHTARHSVAAPVLKTLYPDLAGFETVDVDNRIKPLPALVNLIFSRQPNHAARFFNYAFRAKLEHILQTFKPDVVQLESIFLATYLPYIRAHSHAVNVLRLHNIEYQVWARLADQVKNLPKRSYLKNLSKRVRVFEEQAWKNFDLLLPITEVDAEVVRLSGANAEIIVAPYGIDTSNAPLAQGSGQWTGYHIGAMDWLPNAEAMNWFFKEVWPGIHRELPNFRFFFAGRNMPDSFKELSLLGVTCMSEVPDADDFIKDKQILIVPLLSGGGIRVKILEAMAKAKLVISTDIGMQGIRATPGVHYLQANDPSGFVEAIKWALSHKAEATAIAQNATTLIKQHYGQPAIMQNIIQGLERHLV